jgi:hypothetical protein
VPLFMYPLPPTPRVFERQASATFSRPVMAWSSPYFFVGFQPWSDAFRTLADDSAFALDVDEPTTVPSRSTIFHGLEPLPLIT